MIAATEQTIDEPLSFQELKTNLHRQIVDSIDMSKAGEMGEADFRSQLEALANHISSRPDIQLTDQEQKLMVRQLMDEIYGFGPLQTFNGRSRRE